MGEKRMKSTSVPTSRLEQWAKAIEVAANTIEYGNNHEQLVAAQSLHGLAADINGVLAVPQYKPPGARDHGREQM